MYWPKPTTRRLMGLVAAVALLLWSILRGPAILDELQARRAKANAHEASEAQFRAYQRDRLAVAQDFKAERERWRRATSQPDALTARYLAARYDRQVIGARYAGARADHYAGLKRKYRRALWRPWESVPRNPPSPSNPLEIHSPPNDFPGKHYHLVTEGLGTSLAFAPNAEILAVGTEDQGIKLFDPASGKLIASLAVLDGTPYRLAFSPDGRWLIAGTIGPVGTTGLVLRRWDVATRHAGRDLRCDDATPGQPGSSRRNGDFDYAPDGQAIAMVAIRPTGGRANPAHAVGLFDPATGTPLWEHSTSDWVSALAFAPDGQTLACASGLTVRLLDAATGAPRATLKPPLGYIKAVAFAPDGRTVAGAGSDSRQNLAAYVSGRLILWDVPDGSVRRILDAPSGPAQTVAFSPDGRRVAVAGRMPARPGRVTNTGVDAVRVSEVRVWDTATGALVWTAAGAAESYDQVALAFAPDGRTVAFLDSDRCYLLNAEDGRVQRVLMETTTRWELHDRHR